MQIKDYAPLLCSVNMIQDRSQMHRDNEQRNGRAGIVLELKR